VLNERAKGISVERRKAKRNQIQVDIEIAHPGKNRCRGFAENISNKGVSVILWEGAVPPRQRSVILNFKVWTGKTNLYRRIYARVVRSEKGRIALEFSEHDFIAEAIIQDLIYYQRRERRAELRNTLDSGKTTMGRVNTEPGI
jgi:c-di-GMP-binding flagellar brake protein YcgR